MRAILLAAGFGTRLRPLTDTVPKCLVLIHGKPLLQIWLESLARTEIQCMIINTHYLPEQVEHFVNNSDFRNNVTLAYEPVLLGTAGTLLNNINFFEGEDGMLIHADNYCLADMQEFINAHRQRPKHCLMTMMTFRTNTPSSCGIVELDAKRVVTGFYEKAASPPGNLANGAVYILSKELLDFIRLEKNDSSDFSTEIIPLLMGRIYAYETDKTFLDIGTPEAYATANVL
jgi:mannose-1-phosphate guanylyltransferase